MIQTIRKISTFILFAALLGLAPSPGMPVVWDAATDGSGTKIVAATLHIFSGTAHAASTKKGNRPISPHTILVKVNDEPITVFDVKMRAAFLALQTNIGKRASARFKSMIRSKATMARFKEMQREVITGNPGKSRAELIKIFRAKQKRYAMQLQQRALRGARQSAVPKLRKKALDELIKEVLQVQAAKKLKITIPKSQVDRVIADIAKRNKKTPKKFAKDLARMGSHISTMRSRMKAAFAWRRLIRRRFGALVSINDAQIDNVISSSQEAKNKNAVKLKLQRIMLRVPVADNQAVVAQRYSEAERIARRFRSCKSMARLTKGVANAKFQNLGLKSASAIAEPARTQLLNAADGQMAPPILSNDGVVLYAVCGRKTARGDDKQRAAAKGELRQKEFASLAKRHMRDVRAEAHICRSRTVPYTRLIPPC